MESPAHRFPQNKIVVVHGIVGNGLELGCIPFAVFSQNGFVGADIDDSSHQSSGFFVVGNDFTFQGHGQFINERSIYKF